MRSSGNTQIHKRPVNLTLNAELVAQAKAFTGNLSGVVESLLMEYVERERQQHSAQAAALEKTVTTWNDFSARHASIADEYSTL